MDNKELHEKYHLELKVEESPRKLSSWKKHAWQQIERWLDDKEFHDYCANQVLSKCENPPGPFTRFLYWFAGVCQTGWGVMIDFNEYQQKTFLCDNYYKWMHKLRDEILELRETQTNAQNPSL